MFAWKAAGASEAAPTGDLATPAEAGGHPANKEDTMGILPICIVLSIKKTRKGFRIHLRVHVGI